MMVKSKITIWKVASIGSVFLALSLGPSVASKNIKTSLLKSNQSFRSNFSSQPNLDKGEVALPVQVSIIYVIKQSLPDFLSQLASRNSIKLTLSDEVSGVLTKISLPMQLELILPELSKTYGLEWHMQSDHLYVSNSLENVNRLISLENMSFLKFKEAINAADINPGANKMSFKEDKNSVTIIGSSKYVAKIEAIVRKYQTTAQSN